MHHLRICAFLGLAAALPLAGQALKLNPAALNFSYQLGAATLPAAQTVAVSPAAGTASLTFAAVISGGSWATVTPDTGKTNASLKVSVNPSTLPVGTYTAALAVTPAGGTTGTVPITLTVKAPPSTLTATPNPVTVSYTRGGVLPSPFTINLSGNGALMSYTAAAAGAAWMSLNPKSGIIFPAFTAPVTVTVDPSGLAPGTYKGTLTFTSASASNKTASVDVTLMVNPGAPALNSIFPTAVVQGASATTLTLTGGNFYTGTAVMANGNALTATVLGETTLQASLPSSLLAAAGALSITVSNPNPGGGTSAAQIFTIYPPGPRILGITNAASYAGGAIAPGEMVSIFGYNLGPTALTPFALPGPGAPLATSLAGVTVTFGTTPAPLIFVSETQLAAMVPYGLAGVTVPVTVTYNAATSQAVDAPLAAAAPGVFTLGASGSGQAAVFNYDASSGLYTLNADSNAAPKGSVIVLYVTGIGVTNPAGADGALAASAVPFTTPAVSVQVGGADCTLQYVGSAPGLVDGLVQINAQLPSGITASRTTPLIVSVGSQTSQAGVTIAVK